MTAKNLDFDRCFKALKSVLVKYEKDLRVIINRKDNYSLNAGYDEKRKADIYFGAVQIKKNYVSFHLMPVYMNPKLLSNISPDLKKRMQGKSCFNFQKVNESLFNELSILTSQGFEYYEKNGMI